MGVEEVGEFEEGGDGTRQPQWFATGPGPAQRWPCPRQFTPPIPHTPSLPACLFPPPVSFLFQPPLSLICRRKLHFILPASALFFPLPPFLPLLLIAFDYSTVSAYTCEAQSGLQVRSLKS